MQSSVKRPFPRRVKKQEESLQKSICRYLRANYPDLIFRSDFASGLYLSKYQAVTHASMQSGRGFPDLFIYQKSASGLWSGMALELKKSGTTVYLKNGPNKGKLTSDIHIQEQAAMLKRLRENGYYADFAVGLDDAISKIDKYMGKPENLELF